jgi:hypothetical protein
MAPTATAGSGGIDDYEVQHLREALATDPRVGELELEVRAVAGKLFISGTVPTDERRLAIDEVAREIVPETTVCNETTVQRFAGSPRPERLT